MIDSSLFDHAPDSATLTRFLSKVREDGECWAWTARQKDDGYGVFRLSGRMQLAHRVAVEWAGRPLGRWPMVLDHLCENRSCVRPSHLNHVHVGINTARSKALIASCPQGHRYSDENTYRNPGSGYRSCLTCMRASSWLYDQRRRPGRHGRPLPDGSFRLPQTGRRATCPAGHPYDEENTYIRLGHRYCRACRKARDAGRKR